MMKKTMMKKLKWAALLASSAIIAWLGADAFGQAKAKESKKESQEDVVICYLCDAAGMPMLRKDTIEVKHSGRVYYVCNKREKVMFEKNPEKYIFANDPVSGNKVNKADTVIYKHKNQPYFFESVENRERFKAEPEKYLKK